MKKTGVLFAAVLLLCFVSGCGEDVNNEVVSSVFPVSYTAYTNPYSITGYQIGTDDNGNTTVILYGIGYCKVTVNLFGGGGANIPAWCGFESGGETYACLGASAGSDTIEYSFTTSAVPEKITFTHGQTDEILVSFSVADEPQKN